MAVVAAFLSIGLLLLYYSAAHLTILWATLTGAPAGNLPHHSAATLCDIFLSSRHITGHRNAGCSLLFNNSEHVHVCAKHVSAMLTACHRSIAAAAAFSLHALAKACQLHAYRKIAALLASVGTM